VGAELREKAPHVIVVQRVGIEHRRQRRYVNLRRIDMYLFTLSIPSSGAKCIHVTLARAACRAKHVRLDMLAQQTVADAQQVYVESCQMHAPRATCTAGQRWPPLGG